jgi:hypothetical protein
MEWYEVPFTEALLWITALKDFHGTGIYYTTTEGETLRDCRDCFTSAIMGSVIG